MSVVLRKAKRQEAGEIARLHREVRLRSMPYLPVVHTPEEDVAFFAAVLDQETVWIAVEDQRIVGFCSFRGEWLNHLYVATQYHGFGIGTALLAKAQEASAVLQLWTFQQNQLARRFYERRGFKNVEETDGSTNEERVSDARYIWKDAP